MYVYSILTYNFVCAYIYMSIFYILSVQTISSDDPCTKLHGWSPQSQNIAGVIQWLEDTAQGLGIPSIRFP